MSIDWKEWFLHTLEGNRTLTNNVLRSLAKAEALDATPVPPMRSFRDMMLEVWGIERAYIKGAANDEWTYESPPESLKTASIAELLSFGKSVQDETKALWPKVSVDALTKVRPEPFWGGPDGNLVGWLTYALENEIHHRGQGYVYLRLLGQEPPEFYVREELE